MARAKPSASALVIELFGRQQNFDEKTWRLHNSTPAAHPRQSTINWAIDMGAGGLLTDPQHYALWAELRWVVVTRILDPREGKAAAATTAATLGNALTFLAQWMASEGLTSLSEISSDESWLFVEHVVGSRLQATGDSEEEAPRGIWEQAEEEQDERASLSFTATINRLGALHIAYAQRAALRDAGAASLPEAPFEGRTPYDVVVNDVGLSREGKLEPIPDDVAIPTLNAAVRLLGQPADDVISLQAQRLALADRIGGEDALDRPEKGAMELLTRFEFSVLAGEEIPWQARIRNKEVRTYRDGRTVTLEPFQKLRRLIIDIMVACAIVLQGLTGVRSHELIGLVLNEETDDGLPSLVSLRQSRDKTVDLFILNGRTFKGSRKGDAEWLLGSRLTGTQIVPITLRALEVLARLLEPWRRLSGRRDLFLTFSSSRSLPRRGAGIGRMTSMTMTTMMKDFVYERVDLSQASLSSRQEFEVMNLIRGYRWRTTFATFVYRISDKLLPVISMHFQHTRTAMTMQGYIGNNPALIEACNSARSQTSAEYLLRLASPNTKVIGGGSLVVAKLKEELQELINLQDGSTLMERAVSTVDKYRFYIYDSAYSLCLAALRPNESECNKIEGGAGWRMPFPNDTYRSPQLCGGCRNMVVTQEHREFHQRRADSNEALAAEAKKAGSEGSAVIAERRARQSRQYLLLLDA
ncbi:hypothetical protein [Pseudoxanthomonas mexicana]